MADEKTFTQADIDALKESISKLETKNDELVGEVRKYKAEARRAGDITPEALAAVEAERDKALADLGDAKKQIGALTKERDNAVKSLETESAAARSYALDAEISSAIASGNVVPALVPAFTALLKQQAKADLVDGKYAVMIGDKPARDYIKGFLDSEDGKAYRAAAANGGGGAPGGGGASGAKTMGRADFDALPHGERANFIREGGQVVDAAA